MAGPWEDYQKKGKSDESGPWMDYQAAPAFPKDARTFGQKAVDAAVGVANKIDSYTGAPVRAAIGEFQKSNDLVAAGRALKGQFGEDPKRAPTERQIAQKAGVSTEKIPFQALPLPFKAAALAGYGPTYEDAAAVGIGATADLSNIIPAAGLAGKLAKGSTTFAKAGQGLQKGAEVVSGLASKLGRKTAATLTGLPEKDIATYARRTGEVEKLIKDSGGELPAAADKIREDLQTAIRAKRKELSDQVGKSLQAVGPERNIDIQPVLAQLEKAKGALNPNYDRGAIGQIDELIQEIKRGANAQSSPFPGVEKTEYLVSAKDLHDIKELLQDRARSAYLKDGQIFQAAPQSARAAKAAGAIARKQINSIAPEVGKANNQLAALHELESRLNKNLLSPGKSDSALYAAGSGSNQRNQLMLKKMGDITGYPIQQKAENLSAARTFKDAQWLPADNTGKSVARMLGGFGAGFLVAGPKGAIALGALTSPAALKFAIRTGRVSTEMVSKLAGGAKDLSDATIGRAFRALNTAEGQAVLKSYRAGAPEAEGMAGGTRKVAADEEDKGLKGAIQRRQRKSSGP